MDSLLVRMRGSRINGGHCAAAVQGARRFRQRTVSHQRISASSRTPRLSPIVRHLGGGDKGLSRQVCTHGCARGRIADAAPPRIPT